MSVEASKYVPCSDDLFVQNHKSIRYKSIRYKLSVTMNNSIVWKLEGKVAKGKPTRC